MGSALLRRPSTAPAPAAAPDHDAMQVVTPRGDTLSEWRAKLKRPLDVPGGAQATGAGDGRWSSWWALPRSLTCCRARSNTCHPRFKCWRAPRACRHRPKRSTSALCSVQRSQGGAAHGCMAVSKAMLPLDKAGDGVLSCSAASPGTLSGQGRRLVPDAV